MYYNKLSELWQILPADNIETVKAPRQISFESDTRKALNRNYRKEASVFISLHPICEVASCSNKSASVHHKEGRIGDLLMDKSKWLAVCISCHQKIEHSPEWAKENGYSDSRLAI